MATLLRYTLLSLLSISCFMTQLAAQESQEPIIDAFDTYTEAPREVAYVHLNKSTYIEGEIMGFTAYVFDKHGKTPSSLTSNLYCTISDLNGEVIKKKLLKVENGVVANAFDIDSTLSSGVFTFKAYTNWMRNFKENNHFEQTFKVIDADNLQQIKPITTNDIKVDLQVLGEGGHIVYNLPNTLGIIAKNQFGSGIKGANGQLMDDEDNIISEFKLNNVGITKVLLTPKPNKKYYVQLNLENEVVKQEIKAIKLYGLSMALVELGDKVVVKIQTNDKSLNQFQNKKLKIVLHNGQELKLTDFSLNENGMAILSYGKDNLFSGINIFTVFIEDDQPILERLFFNKGNIKLSELTSFAQKSANDTLAINAKLSNISDLKWSNISVSVLPKETKSYNHHNTLLSQLFIQPYINGVIEEGAQYFKNTRESNYNLDLLMLTQGWSSYNWNTIFNSNGDLTYPFEQGIDVVANINGNNPGTYVVYPAGDTSTQIFEAKEGEKKLLINNLFPMEDNIFRVGYLDTKKKDFSKKPTLFMQYFPSVFPIYANENNSIEAHFSQQNFSFKNTDIDKAWDNDAEALDEVIVNAEKEYTRAEKLINKAINSRVDVIDDRTKYRNQRLDLYIQRLGFNTQFDYFSGTLSITNPRVNWGTNVPLVYLNGALLTTLGSNSDFSLLTFLYVNDIDYIEYELYGVGGGIRGQAGFIKIVTNKTYNSGKKDNVQAYTVPLKFSNDKTFYLSKYKYYNTDFFKEYGTIGWEPKLKVNANGDISFSVPDTETEAITLFIEGIVNDDTYVSQEVTLERDN